MILNIDRNCDDFNSFRAAKVKSLFNAESGANFSLSVDLPIEDLDWQIGVIVGPSGSGKTSIGAEIFGGNKFYAPKWKEDEPIIDGIGETLDQATSALQSVGLGTVPTWLRPYDVLSNGESFRANMARLLCDKPDEVVVDEFTSVVDRQIARIGSMAFAKAWRRGDKKTQKAVLITPHYDVLEWIEPCWYYDTAEHKFARGDLRRPTMQLEIIKTDSSYWRYFKEHHYLDLPPMVGGHYYIGQVNGELVAHVCVATKAKGKRCECRAARLVVMPEWQGAGIGTRFLDAVADIQKTGERGARIEGRPMNTLVNTSHPGLCAALRKSPKWGQISQALYGSSKAQDLKSGKLATGYGGHLRAIQGFRYHG